MDVEQAQTIYHTLYGKRMIQKEVSRPQRAEPRAAENQSQGGSSGP